MQPQDNSVVNSTLRPGAQFYDIVGLFDDPVEQRARWRIRWKFIIIIFLTLGRYITEGVKKLRYTKLGTDLSVRAVRGWQAVM